ncbi:unnamed protein product [Lathyrus sativus]|nr:unnamed protein product [Lathyrus sativus]
MGRLLLINLEGYFYSCNHCDTPLALVNHLLSTKFECPYKGRAYLFDKVVNVLDGEREDPVPGSHSTIVKIFCGRCEYFLGWKFVFAYAVILRYKEGKFILAR